MNINALQIPNSKHQSSGFMYNSLISVMEKLPPTSYVRLVDLWLISTQLVPFLLVVMTTSIELFQDQGAEINHHGFARFLR